MRILRQLGSKVVVLAVAMLAAIGSWEVYKGTIREAASNGFVEALKCYRIAVIEENPRVKGTIVWTLDQFAEEKVRLKDGELLCVRLAQATIVK